MLSVQPGNRAAQRLAIAIATEIGATELARLVATDILAGPPYRVTTMGVWNDYANHVIISADSPDSTIEDEARTILGLPTEPSARA